MCFAFLHSFCAQRFSLRIEMRTKTRDGFNVKYVIVILECVDEF
jgi:hypothetical protein